MDDRFSDWYRTVDPALRADTLENRWGVIAKLAKRMYWDLALDLVRLYAGSPQLRVHSAVDFVSEFKKADPTLPIKDNDQLVRVLAGATLAAVLSTNDAVADATALALVSARFARHDPEGVNADLEEDADRYLVHRSRMCRTQARETKPRKRPALATSIEELEIPELPELGQMANYQHYGVYNTAATHIEAYATEVGATLGKLRDLVADMAKAETTLGSGLEAFPEWNAAQEELNILWWLYGESSRDLGRPVADLGIQEFAMMAGKELADLTTLVPGILASEAMVRRALRATGGAPDAAIPLKTMVEALPADWRRTTVEAAGAPPASVGSITPLHMALRRSMDDGEGWLAAFLGAAGLSSAPELQPVVAAQQMYTERLLGRALLAAGAAPRSKRTLVKETESE